MSEIAAAAPSIVMLGCFACIAGGIALLRRGQDRTKGVLLLVMAVVLFGNVLVWTI